MQTATGINLPGGYDRVKVVGSLADVFGVALDETTDCVVYERSVPGMDINAEALARAFNRHAVWSSFTRSEVAHALAQTGDEGLRFIFEDMQTLQSHCAALDPRLVLEIPTLDPRLRIATHEWHADGQPDSDNFRELILCNYAGATTQGARHSDARLKRDGIGDNEYDVAPGSPHMNFGHFNIWRFKTEYYGMKGHAFIHRAPPPVPGAGVRALLVASRKPASPG
ncbi:MAG: hypothetical protein JWO78_447 [Micavibrio sp.]|nr:hypothetical protein [Micavibrio sp.]